jgi:hypothetical protein
MARGKYLSFEEARRMSLLNQFAKEHPSEGDEAVFDQALDAIASGKRPAKRQTSPRETSDD